MFGIIGIYLFVLALAGLVNVASYSAQKETGAATLSAVFAILDFMFGLFLVTHH